MIQDAGTGSLVIEGTNLHLRAADDSPYLIGTDNAHVKLYSPVDGNEQARIDDDGVHITNEANTGTLTVRNTSLFQNDIAIEGSTNAVTVTWDKSTNTLNFDDNNFATFGTSGDLSIYHDGQNSFISDTGVGPLRILSNDLLIKDSANTTTMARFTESGAAELYYNNDIKLSTMAGGDGINVTGITYSDGLDMGNNHRINLGGANTFTIYTDGSDSYITETGTGSLIVSANNFVARTTDGENYINAVANGATTLYYNNASKIATTNEGVYITNEANTSTLTVRNTSLFQNNITIESATGSVTWTKSTSTLNFDDNNFATFGTSGDMSLYHNGNNSVIENNTGELILQSTGITLRSDQATPETYLTADLNGAVTLYHDNVIKLTTDTNGIIANGTVFADGLDMGNNDIIALGDNDNFKIFTNNGGESILRETGAGSMLLQANNLILEDTDGNDYLFATAGGAVSLTHAGITKFATTSGGIDVDGTAVTNGLQVDGFSDLNGNVDLGAGTGSTISFIGRVDTTINPSANNTHNLGADALRWDKLWVGGNGTIANLIGENDAVFESNVEIQDSLSVNNSIDATSFSGSGALLTSLNASNISSGTINDARLPNQITSDITGTAASANTVRISTGSLNSEYYVNFTQGATGQQDIRSDANFRYNPDLQTLEVTNLIVNTNASLPSDISFSNTTTFENIFVSNLSLIHI